MMTFLITAYCPKIVENTQSNPLRKELDKLMHKIMLMTGIYSLFNKADLNEMVYRLFCTLNHEENQDYFLNGIIYNGSKKGIPISLTEQDLLSYFGAYLFFKEVNLTQEQWYLQNKFELRYNRMTGKDDNTKTAGLIAKCVTQNISGKAEKAVQKDALDRITYINKVQADKKTFAQLIDLLGDQNLLNMLAIVAPGQQQDFDLAIELIRFQWLFHKGYIIIDEDSTVPPKVVSGFRFNLKIFADQNGKIDLDYVQNRYDLKKLNHLFP